MIPRWAEWALWIGGMVGLAVGLAGFGLSLSVSNESPGMNVPDVRVGVPAESIAAWARAVIERDPFRLARRPAATPFGSDDPKPEIPSRPPVSLPTLIGIVGGPPWQALMAGVANRPAPVLLSPGDSIAGMVVRAVGPDTVLVAIGDSVLRLTVRQPWR